MKRANPRLIAIRRLTLPYTRFRRLNYYAADREKIPRAGAGSERAQP